METTEKIVEAYVRYIRGWATIPNIKCGQFEIDLLAIDPIKLGRYHIETSVSVSAGFAKLTGKPFDSNALKDRVHGPTQRRTIGFFIKRKFGPAEVFERLAEFGFVPGTYKRVIVSWGCDAAAKSQAADADIELWDFPDIMQKIAQEVETKTAYYGDDTLRTLHLFARALKAAKVGKHGMGLVMEHLQFATSREFMRWAQRVVRGKDQSYDRIPVGKQTWTYGDGHVVETEWGKRGGTMLANLDFMLKTAPGDLEQPRDAQLVKDIDSRGGVTVTIDWGE
jgi:hypothetical protein